MEPMSLDSAELLDTPIACLRELRSQAAVCPVAHGGVLVTRSREVREILLDPRLFSSQISKHNPPPAEIAAEVLAIREQGWPYTPALGASDAPRHGKHRRLVNRAFTPRSLAAVQPLVDAAAEELASGLPDGVEVDILSAFAEPLTVWAISQILGLPAEERDKVRTWSIAAVSTIGATPDSQKWLAHEHELLDMQLTLNRLILDSKASGGGRGLIAEIAQVVDDPDEGIDMATMLTLLRELVVAGNETTGKFISEMARLIGADEAMWDRIRDENGYAERVVEECLRLVTPTQTVKRRATADTVIDGVSVPQGTIVYASLASANRDELVFSEGDEVRPEREGMRYAMAFGQGPHMCIGAGLARQESVAALKALARHVRSIEPVSCTYTRSWIIRGPIEMRGIVRKRSNA